MNQKIRLLFISFLILSNYTFAQIGGTKAYQFLNVPVSARAAALGGNVVSIYDNDLSFVFDNPALLNKSQHNNLVMNFVNYFADLSFTQLAYARNYKKLGTFAASVHRASYGTFTRTDAVGNIFDNFTAAETALNLSYARDIDSLFHIGVTIKNIFSNFDTYSSYGLAFDLGGVYTSHDKKFTMGMVVKNIGRQITSYASKQYKAIPFEAQVGFTKQMSHAPLRLTLLLNNLQKWDLTHQNINTPIQIDSFTGDTLTTGFTVDKLARHLAFGIEILITKGFNIRLGYNHQRRKELNSISKGSLSGFSYGFGFRISKFNLSYTHSSFIAGGTANHFSVTTNFSNFRLKKNKTTTFETP